MKCQLLNFWETLQKGEGSGLRGGTMDHTILTCSTSALNVTVLYKVVIVEITDNFRKVDIIT